MLFDSRLLVLPDSHKLELLDTLFRDAETQPEKDFLSWTMAPFLAYANARVSGPLSRLQLQDEKDSLFENLNYIKKEITLLVQFNLLNAFLDYASHKSPDLYRKNSVSNLTLSQITSLLEAYNKQLTNQETTN